MRKQILFSVVMGSGKVTPIKDFTYFKKMNVMPKILSAYIALFLTLTVLVACNTNTNQSNEFVGTWAKWDGATECPAQFLTIEQNGSTYIIVSPGGEKIPTQLEEGILKGINMPIAVVPNEDNPLIRVYVQGKEQLYRPITLEERQTCENKREAQRLYEVGNQYFNAKMWQQAITTYEEAVELDPTFQAARHNLGHSYLQQALASGEPLNATMMNEAIRQLEQVIELDSNFAISYYSLGLAYQALEQKEEAIHAFEKFLDLEDGSDSEAKTEAENYLQELKN